MRPVQSKRILPALSGFWLVFCLIAGSAQAQIQEHLQDQLVDAMRQAAQETDQAAGKFKANDIPGGCSDLNAAAMDTADSLDMANQLTAMIRQEDHETTHLRARMLHDLKDMSASLAAQKQDLDSQIGSHCG